MSARPDTAPPTDWPAEADHAASGERTAYVQGWWWGFASGLICGSFSAGLLGFLLWTVQRALACPTC